MVNLHGEPFMVNLHGEPFMVNLHGEPEPKRLPVGNRILRQEKLPSTPV
jgi:hypothetical protein